MATLHWMRAGDRWHAKAGSGAYQIIPRTDGRFDVVHYATPKSLYVLRATADTVDSAKDFAAIDFAKARAA